MEFLIVDMSTIDDRVQVGLRISEPEYVVGLVYLLERLYMDYFTYILLEDRMKGIMNLYKSGIQEFFRKYYLEEVEDGTSNYKGKVVYLYKSQIYAEFRKLGQRTRLSYADRTITIIKRILEFLDSKGYIQGSPNLEMINEVAVKLFDNIRWRQKNTKLKSLMMKLSVFFDLGKVGKRDDFNFSLLKEDEKYSKRLELNPETVLINNTSTEIKEVGL